MIPLDRPTSVHFARFMSSCGIPILLSLWESRPLRAGEGLLSSAPPGRDRVRPPRRGGERCVDTSVSALTKPGCRSRLVLEREAEHERGVVVIPLDRPTPVHFTRFIISCCIAVLLSRWESQPVRAGEGLLGSAPPGRDRVRPPRRGGERCVDTNALLLTRMIATTQRCCPPASSYLRPAHKTHPVIQSPTKHARSLTPTASIVITQTQTKATST